MDIKLIIYDFDGVMTDNKALLMDDGREAVFIHRGDGLAVSKIKEAGIAQIIVSTETNPIVSARAKKLGILALQSVSDKKSAVEKILKDQKIDPQHVVFVGNDFNDEAAMRLVGWPMAPSDACAQIKKIAKTVFSAKGGEGVVRELWDLLNIQK